MPNGLTRSRMTELFTEWPEHGPHKKLKLGLERSAGALPNDLTRSRMIELFTEWLRQGPYEKLELGPERSAGAFLLHKLRHGPYTEAEEALGLHEPMWERLKKFNSGDMPDVVWKRFRKEVGGEEWLAKYFHVRRGTGARNVMNGCIVYKAGTARSGPEWRDEWLPLLTDIYSCAYNEYLFEAKAGKGGIPVDTWQCSWGFCSADGTKGSG